MTQTDHYKRLIDVQGADRFRRLGAVLEAVEQHGSLNKATTALGNSYRYAWGLLRQAELVLGAALLTRRVGGAAGGGATLTETACDLLVRYRRLQNEVDQILSDPVPDPARPILLASTIGPAETGLLDTLEAAFHAQTGLWVRHIAAGTGQALEIARAGRVDLVLAHAPTEEERFLQEGWGTSRHPLMTNDFLLCGPPADPAQVRETSSATEAMRRIARHGARFLSRGDQSGTHQREVELWRAAGVSPAAPWYQYFERGAQGSAVTLQEAELRGAYTLVDGATYAKVAPADSKILLRGDPLFHNLFSLVLLHPARLPHANHPGAARLATWATSEQGQHVIATSAHFRPVGGQPGR